MPDTRQRHAFTLQRRAFDYALPYLFSPRLIQFEAVDLGTMPVNHR